MRSWLFWAFPLGFFIQQFQPLFMLSMLNLYDVSKGHLKTSNYR